jgi:hypothetical protein
MGARAVRASRRLVGTSLCTDARARPSIAAASAGPARRKNPLMSDSEQPVGGELNAAVTSALVGIHYRHLGRGPKTASTFHYGNVLVTVMHEY